MTASSLRRTALSRPDDWRSRGACVSADPELFFPVGERRAAAGQAAAAKSVCARCAVIRTCLRWALDQNQDTGVWGGLTETERRTIRRNERDERTRAHSGQPNSGQPNSGQPNGS